MPKINAEAFSSLKKEIKAANTAQQFKGIYQQITSYTPDSNLRDLSIYFNKYRQLQGDKVSQNCKPIDISHIDMLIELHRAALMVRAHINFLGYSPRFHKDPFNFERDYWQVREKIESMKPSAETRYYQDYFMAEIHGVLKQYHIKLTTNPPKWIADEPPSFSMLVI